jgi:aminoglycoside phosphotransferase (APT) family kinase protein
MSPFLAQDVTDRTAAALAAGPCAAPPDFLGRSFLPLLAALPSHARVLFLIDPSHAIVNSGSIADAQFVSVSLSGTDRLPFDRDSFDCVVLDTSLVSSSPGVRANPDSETILEDIARLLKHDGQLIISTPHRRVPRNKRALGRYRLFPPDRQWERRLHRTCLEIKDVAFACADGLRLTEIFRTATPLRPDVSAAADYKLIRCGRTGTEPGTPVVDAIVADMYSRLQTADRLPFHLQKLAIRKIGKTLMCVAAPGGRSYIARIPRSGVAAERALRNFAALAAIKANQDIPPKLRALVPCAAFTGTCADYPYYVEECRVGKELVATSWLPPAEIWQPAALQFITGLHLSTKRLLYVDQDRYRMSFGSPLQRIRAECSQEWTYDVLDRLEEFIQQRVIGRTIPFVWTHGDFFLGNCLYDSRGELTGVVDWELFSDVGLPLLDLVQCMRIPGERNAYPSWQRFSTVYELVRYPPRIFESEVLAQYIRDIEIPTASLPALLVMHWVDHVANRIRGRSSDPVWMTKRVYAPLRMLAQLQSDMSRGASVGSY